MRRTAAVTVISMVVLAGCDGGQAEPPAAQPRVSWQGCPDDIAVTVTSSHRCGTLTVPVSREHPEGPGLSLEVVQIFPPGEQETAAVAASVGFNFGEPRQEPGLMASLAERLGVAVVSLTPRGVGAAGGTALDCPGFTGLGAAAATEPDRVGRDRFLAAVGVCRQQLVERGVDLSGFGLDDLVADLEALRAALAVERWHALVTYGEMARVSDGYVARHGDRVRAVVKDSPPAPSGPISAAADGTRSALTALFEECRDDPSCASRYPDLEATWDRALDRARARPLRGVGPDGDVLVDAPKLVRAVRAMLGGDGPAHVPDLPRVIVTAADGEVHPTLAGVLADDPDHCAGYRPLCTKPGFSPGAYLSQVCSDAGPDGAAPEEHTVHAEVFGSHPYRDACRAWDVAPAGIPAVAPGAPTLVLTGHLDAWSRAEWFDGAVSVRGATHDVAGSSPCVLPVRNRWVADPSTPADPAPCDGAPFPAWD